MTLRYEDESSIRTIREYFTEVAYSYVDYRILGSREFDIFPDFRGMQDALKSAYPIYRLLLSLFRQGHPAEEGVLRQAFRPDLLEALQSVGLLVRNEYGEWQTPGIAIVPIAGLYLAVSLPPQYPTAANKKQPVYLGADSLWLTKALPQRLDGKTVLDICSGSGIQALTCALRGARRVVGLEYSPVAVNLSRFNAALNGLSDVVEIRESDLLSALREDERFDFVVSNPPFMPVMEDVAYPICGTGGFDGMRLMRRIFRDVPRYLQPEAEAFIICNAFGSQFSISLNKDVLEPLCREHGLFARAYIVSKAEFSLYVSGSLEPNLKNTCPELSDSMREEAIRNWKERLADENVESDFIYEQIIRIWKGRGDAGMMQLPSYNPHGTDPLFRRVAVAQAHA